MNTAGVLLLAALPLASCKCEGGPGGQSYYEGITESKLLYDNSRNLSDPGASICELNRCHGLKLTISKIAITAGPGTSISCMDGGIGVFKFVMKLSGSGAKSFQAKIWGDYDGEILQKTTFSCLQDKLYNGKC